MRFLWAAERLGVWRAKNRDRLLHAIAADRFLIVVVGRPLAWALNSNEGYFADCTLVEAWTSYKLPQSETPL